MQYCTFQDIQLSRLGMGNMRLPVTGENGDTIDVAKARTIRITGANSRLSWKG